MPETSRDDRPTMVAISAIACVLQDVLHEGLGHGVTAWLSGAHRLTMSTVALQSDLDTRPMAAAGTLVNLIFAAVFWLLLRRPQRYRPATRYFLVLALMGNLFTGTGYFFFSGVTNFGDWAAVIQGLKPHWAWQLGLVVVGVASYYASMVVVGAVFHRRLAGRTGRSAESPRTLLCDRVGAALHAGRERRPAQPAQLDAMVEAGPPGGAGCPHTAPHRVDCRRSPRQPAVYLRTGPWPHLVAMTRSARAAW